MGSGLVRYKAEVDFDGRELTRSYLDKQDLEMMLEEVRSMKSINEMEAFLLKHGENIGIINVCYLLKGSIGTYRYSKVIYFTHCS